MEGVVSTGKFTLIGEFGPSRMYVRKIRPKVHKELQEIIFSSQVEKTLE